MATALGLSRTIGDLLSLILTAALLAGAWRSGHAGTDEGERRAFGLAVLAALTCSPVVWPHYMTLVFIPIALLSPELSALWLVPLLAYLAPGELTGGDIFRILPYVAIELIVVACLCPSEPSGARRRRSLVSRAHGGSLEGRADVAGRLRRGLRTTL